MLKIVLPISLILSVSLNVFSLTKTEYIQKWSSEAILQMNSYGIPASITLAQGILESGFGNSKLAVSANNHFGIKCHNWEGEKVYSDDDRKDECFRAYSDAKESFNDHSLFLSTRGRYDFLFDLEVTDYKGWAKGLKKAGYATNPKYPSLLIELIEDLNLDQFDEYGEGNFNTNLLLVNSGNENDSHQVLENVFGSKYIVCKKGDTYLEICEEFGLSLNQLNRYNNFKRSKDFLIEGDLVYVRPKKRSVFLKEEKKEIVTEMTLIEVSQTYGVHLSDLKRKNKIMEESALLAKGSSVVLR